MKGSHQVLIAAAALAMAIGLSLTAGCSCEESEAPPARVVKVAKPEPAAPAARGGQEASGSGRAAPSGGGRSLVGESMLRAPGDYYSTVAVKAPRHARKSVNQSVMTRAIEHYRAMHGKYPPSLAALSEWTGDPIPEPPPGHKHVYDPKTGKLDIVPTDE